ncbi:PQQ-dependent sugar dehydrogenase [Ramlibacter tataouinensis]|nr:PQQ-dependent sugar dehydrogenase [Ramlibacter tataouinensis]WBY04071.1 PQQ-dependent sugar dehydrogenase [Ramlibacter tataouinensis]
MASLAAGVAAQPRATPVAAGLEHPWAVAFLDEGRFLVTERPGRMRVVEPDGRLGPPLPGVPEVVAAGQGGLLDLVLDSGFATNRTLYFCFSEPGSGGNSTALAKARLASDRSRLEDVQVIFSQKPKVDSRMHFGCRIVEARDGTLFLTTGDRYSRMQDAQRLDNHLGKVIRVTKNGAPAPGNPFVGRDGALPEIWSYGHRNSQGATLAPDGRFWMHEHGAQGGDEINLPEAGRNYGWPVITWGVNYGGAKIGEGLTSKPGMEQPLHYWVPSIAPSGMAFLTSDRYGPGWKGNLFIGSLKFGYLDRVELEGGKVVREHRLLEGVGRVRDVRQGPDGLLYLLTDSANGRLLRLQP